MTVNTQKALSLRPLWDYLRRWWWMGVPLIGWLFTDLDHAGSLLRVVLVLWTGMAGGLIYSHEATTGAAFVPRTGQAHYRAYLWFTWAIYALPWPLIAVTLLLFARPSLLQERDADYLAWCPMLFAISSSYLAMTGVANHRERSFFGRMARRTLCFAFGLLILTLWYGFELTLTGRLLFPDILAASVVAMFALLTSAWVFHRRLTRQVSIQETPSP
jgi:hypothetical protein